ncbi:MAG: efflux RND transporter permease subunit [Ignavibacteria bacterium]|nr:efflux RND transporter permease subunit [Ignavibacteria bacterium]
MIDTRSGDKIPLSYVADIASSSGPNTINRENLRRKTVVSVNVSGRDQKSAVEEIAAKVGSGG